MIGARLLLVPALVWGSLACSCMGKVVVANPTDHPVAVFVTPERRDPNATFCNCPYGYKLDAFRTTSVTDPDKLTRATWTPVDSAAFHWDTGGRYPKVTVAVMLPAGSTLQIADAAYDCGGGVIGYDLPTRIELVDGGRQLRLDPISFRERLRKGTKFLMMYEIPTSAPSSPP